MRKSSRALAFVSATVCFTLLAGCGGSKKKETPTPTPSSTTMTTPTPTPTPTPKPKAINPFTGAAPSRNGVVAVKIDDTASGRPQVNIDQADIVYVEQVEGGLTRLLAIYNTRLPIVEAVRSVRANDPELVAQYGRIAYVASGGAPNPLFVLDHSKLKTSINDRGGPGFARDPNRPVPYNLTANLAVAARALGAPRAKDIALTFARKPSTVVLKSPRANEIHTVVGSTPVDFVWNSDLRHWVRRIGGVTQRAASGALISTPNVIVQFCRVTPYPEDVDTAGNVAQFTHSIGKGRAVIFRDGRKIEATWSRSAQFRGTHFQRNGKPVALAPGGAWIILVATGAPLSS